MQVSAIIPTAAGVVELADTPALGAGTGRRRGSSPLSRKRKNKEPEDKSDVFGFSVFPVYFGNCGDLKRSVKDNPSRRRIGQRRRPEAEVLRSVRQVPSPACDWSFLIPGKRLQSFFYFIQIKRIIKYKTSGWHHKMLNVLKDQFFFRL